MGWLVALWTLTGLAVAIPVILLLTDYLRPSEDFFALILYAEFVVYLHLAPTLWAPVVDDQTQVWYAYIQFFCIVLFELPFLWVYFRLKRRAARRKTAPMVFVRGRQQLALVFFCLLFAVTFFYIAVNNGVFFMRLGFEGAVAALLRLTLPEFAVFRSFQLAGTFLACVLLASTFFPQPSWRKKVTWLGFGITAFILLLFHITNSRLHTVLILATFLGIVLLVGRLALFSRRGLAAALIVSVVGAYGVQVALNARDILPQHGFRLGILNPFGRHQSGDGELLDDIRFRLNGIDLMARITPEALSQGFAAGEAWKGGALVELGQLTLGRAVSPELIAEYKESFATSPKRYLMFRYLSTNWADYSSSVLTDTYGNFGLVGLLFAALLLGTACALVTNGLAMQSSPAQLILAMFVAYHLILFEQETLVFITSLLNLLPVLIFIFFVNPFARPAADKVRRPVSLLPPLPSHS